jgi:hypothetical protein
MGSRRRRRRTLGIIRLDFNLNTHIVLAQTLDTNTGIERLVVGHVLAEVSYHSLIGLIIQRKMVGAHFVYLRPSLAACSLQGKVNVLKGLIDLCVDLSGDLGHLACRIPTTYQPELR